MSVFFFLIGAITASFTCCMIERILRSESLLGRSHCDHCHHVLMPADLLPIISFLLLRGRCRYCGSRISGWLFLFELTSGWLFAALYLRYGFSILLLRYLVFFSLLIAIAYNDLLSYQIPDSLLVTLLLSRIFFYQSADNFRVILFKAAYLPLFLLIFSLLFFLVRKKQPMGFGDIKLFYVIGCYFSLEGCVLILLTACLSGIIYCLFYQRKKAFQPFPFVPFILIGAVLTVFFGQQLITFYLLRIAKYP